MPDYTQIAREILQQILAGGPRKGAPLKAVLMREFQRQTGADFNAAFWNFPKFSNFLAANADLVDVSYPLKIGDIAVSLRQPTDAVAEVGLERAIYPTARRAFSFRLPPPLWHAFTNPDPARRRFFHRLMHNVVHFVQGSEAEPNLSISASVQADSNYVEILPATAEQQNRWMREFVKTNDVPHGKRQLIDSLLAIPYTSQLNKTFCTALGEMEEDWNQWRALKIREFVEEWASANGITLDDLSAEITSPESSALSPSPMPFGVGHAEAELRRRLHAAIDSLAPGELPQVLLPAVVLLRLSKDGAR